MLIVNIVGGLGNQMYGYGLYRALLERGRNVFMNLSFYDHQNNEIIAHRDYELSKVFNIKERIVSKQRWFIVRVMKKLRLMRVYRENGFNPEVLNMKHGILSGYWGNFNYFREIYDILRKEFTFRKPLTGKSEDVIKKIRSCNSVSISIRRNDYIKLGHVLPMEYYNNAIRYVQERVPDAKFFCTSDDIDWCKSNLGGVLILHL